MNLGEYESFCSENGNFMQSAIWSQVKENWISEYIAVRNEEKEIVGTMLLL